MRLIDAKSYEMHKSCFILTLYFFACGEFFWFVVY